MISNLTRGELEEVVSTYGKKHIAHRMATELLAAMDSESECLPLDYLQGHKDGLEWAAQLAEANHPETGDWLYDDSIELAKAIRKGPDMPPVQPAADSEPVAEITEDLGRLFVKIHHPTALKAGYNLYLHAQPAPVVPDEKDKTVDADDYPLLWSFNEGWNACRAATLAAAPQPQNAPQNIPDIIPNELIAAVNRLLDSNGIRGCYSAIKCYDAHIEVERLLAAARQEVKP